MRPASRPRHRPVLALAVAALLAACADAPVAPVAPVATHSPMTPRLGPVTPAVVVGDLTIYTDRASWEAAVASAGSSAQLFDFAGLTTGRVTALDTDYGAFRIIVDHVSATSFNNPGIDIFPDASCSLGIGDCEVFTFNMIDPTSLFDAPKVNQLVMAQSIIAFGGDFVQVGYTAGGTPTRTGPVTLQVGSTSVQVDSYLDASGFGFFGFVAGAPGTTMTFTFAKSGTLQNDIFQVYNPAYGVAPTTTPDPVEHIGDLRTLIGGLGLAPGLVAAFDSKLQIALAALGANNTAGACTALQDLLNQVAAQAGKKKLSPTSATAIVTEVQAIRTALGC